MGPVLNRSICGLMFETANYIEAGLWITIGLVFILFGLAGMIPLKHRWPVIAVTLILFGISDIVETRTGAWWKPWWLFVWKALCVLVLAVCVIQHYSQRRKNGSMNPTNHKGDQP